MSTCQDLFRIGIVFLILSLSIGALRLSKLKSRPNVEPVLAQKHGYK